MKLLLLSFLVLAACSANDPVAKPSPSPQAPQSSAQDSAPVAQPTTTPADSAPSTQPTTMATTVPATSPATLPTTQSAPTGPTTGPATTRAASEIPASASFVVSQFVSTFDATHLDACFLRGSRLIVSFRNPLDDARLLLFLDNYKATQTDYVMNSSSTYGVTLHQTQGLNQIFGMTKHIDATPDNAEVQATECSAHIGNVNGLLDVSIKCAHLSPGNASANIQVTCPSTDGIN